ncbi:MAG: VWA domain-containing protein [Ruminococcaceae bacterium]|nr:VWA domain-containing protein [Oscillospiraceae bacterium]
MERKRKVFTRAVSLALAVMMLMSVFSLAFVADAALVEKTQRTYDIAVAFDNSGSMYDNTQAWCQAKYAMEIFASMLDYENGDKLTIFPMWKVTTDSQPEYDANANKNVDPVVIDSKEDINLISNMFTVVAGGTPFEPVEEAFDHLKKSSKTNKWLIVLTDGKFEKLKRDDKQTSNVDVQGKLEEYASKKINVQYLAIKTPTSTAVSLEPRDYLYTAVSEATDLQSDLSEICNRIFKRAVINSKYISGNKITLDISMNNIIVFAQGTDEKVKISGIKNANGESVDRTFDSGVRKYSEISANYLKEEADWNGPPIVDNTLFGHVVTFAACPKGEYTLDCSGAKNIQVFYEPNVDILVTLKDKETGEEVYNSATSEGKIEVVAGKYRLDCKFVDRLTGEDITKSELLGNVELNAAVVASDGKEIKVKKDGIVELKADERTTIKVTGKYLDDYKIETEDNKDGFEINISVKIPEVDDLQIDVEGADNWYTISQNEKWQPMKAKLTLNGQPLTADQMKALEFAVKSSKDSLKLRTETLGDESAIMVYIAKDEADNFVKPETGIYTLEFTGQLPANEYGLRPADSEKKLFEIQNYAEYWRWLIYVVVFAILLALFLMFMSQKVLPKKMTKENASFWCAAVGDMDSVVVDVNYRAKSKVLEIKGPNSVPYEQQCNATFSLKAVDNRFKKSKNRQICIVGISCSTCDEMTVGSTDYVKVNGQWVKSIDAESMDEGKVPSGIKQIVGPGVSVELSRKKASLECTVRAK